MPAALYNITIEPGTTFELSFIWYGASTPINLNYQARLNLRASQDRYSAPFYIANTQNGQAASTPTTGQMYFQITSQQTDAIPFDTGYYEVEVYTLDATPYVQRLLKGKANIDRT